jgi:hypothetical protein
MIAIRDARSGRPDARRGPDERWTGTRRRGDSGRHLADQWQKSDSLYFGLSSDEKENRSKNGFYRVGVSGGKPQFVLRTATWGPYPGLSPDGRFIFAFDTTWDSVLVATAAGKRVDAYKPGPGEVHAGGWSADGKHLFRRVTRRSVNILDLAQRTRSGHRGFGGVPRSGLFALTAGGWPARLNPDTIVLSDLGAGTQRSIALERPLGRSLALDWFMYWSPDGRFLASRLGRRHQLSSTRRRRKCASSLRKAPSAFRALAQRLPRDPLCRHGSA